MRRSRLAIALGAAVVAVTAAVSASSALGASAPAPAAPQQAAVTLARGCLYPPQTRPALTLTGPTSVRKSRSFALTGTVKYNSCGLPSWPVGLYKLNGSQWQLLGTTFTNGSGNYTFSLSGISTSTTFQTRTLPWLGLQAATSSNFRVTTN